jgi:crotonobetainyl-CoA:carnitine CoA-transferase CaiB-like acyl-CoA transferase
MLFEPLDGIRILDLTQSVAGPLCTQVLGILGAEVVKIERPGVGDDARIWGPPFLDGESVTFLALNTGKQSLAVDLKTDAGVDLVLRLAEGCDVVVQSLRPGLAEKRGLGFDAIRARRSDVVYCSIGAFGATGPLADEPGYDPLMQASAGIMSITGEPGRPGVRAGVSLVDQGTGLWAALAILAALRQRDGGHTEAQHLELSLFEVAVNWVPYQLAGYLATGTVPGPNGSGMSFIAPYEAFEAADGMLMIAAANDRLFARLCEALALPELLDDPRFRTNPDRAQHREALRAPIAARIRTGTVADWLEKLSRAVVPAAPIQDMAQVAAFPQTEALGIIQDVARPGQAPLRLVAPPISVDGERLQHRSAPPRLGSGGRPLLRRAELGDDEIADLEAAGVVFLGDAEE